MIKTVSSPISLAVVELSPLAGMIPALQVKLVWSEVLSGYTVRLLVIGNCESDRGDIVTRLVSFANRVVPFSQVTETFTKLVMLGSMSTLQVTVSGVLVPAYKTPVGADIVTEGVGTTWKT